MSQDLTPRQQILLWDLVSRGGSALQKDLKPDVKPADRAPLLKGRYISVTKEARALRLTIEEHGWDFLASTPPSLAGEGSKYDRPILQFVLARVQGYAAAHGVAIANILSGENIKKEAEDVSAYGDEHSQASVEQQIRDTFFAIAGQPPINHVRLHALRERLAHIARDHLDRSLIAMQAGRRAHFSTLNNPADIAREGVAPLDIKGRTYHTIWIDP